LDNADLGALHSRFADLIDVSPTFGTRPPLAALRAAETIGHPLESESFLDEIAALTGRDARPARAEEKGDLVKCHRNSGKVSS
jgi:hypothetical protein